MTTKSNAQNKIRHYKKAPHYFLRRFLIFSGFIITACVLGGAGVFAYYVSTAPKITTNMMASDDSAKLYDSSNHLITKISPQNREYVKSKDIPATLTNGITSIEDRHFFSNHGVDPFRIVEAEFNDLRGRGDVQGGSTITQQLVKLSVFSTKAKDRTMKRKAQEAWLAMKLTRKYPKSKILEYYVNKVYMGHNTYGMKTASKYYYGKPLGKLSLAQYAMLAGMPQSPVIYDPYANNDYATKRRNQVLDAMADDHKISQQEAENAKAESVKQGLVKNHTNNSKSAKIQAIDADYIKQVDYELQGRHFNTHSGLKIYTNLNVKDQKRMYDMANNSSDPGFPNKKMQVGSALVNVHNGDLEAVIGGRHQKNLWGINRADQTTHSNGSTNKPLMDYGPAVQDLDYRPDSTVRDTPFYYPGTDIKLWDFDHKYKGKMTLQDALVQSRNVPAIRLLQQVGVQRARQFMDGMGLYTDPAKTSLQNGIGGYTSPVREAEAYATFADGGIYHQPLAIRKVIEGNGKVHNIHGESHQAMSVETAYIISKMLTGVPNSQDGEHAKVPGLHEAGKTGTTEYPDSYKYPLPSYAVMDSWYAGYTPNLSMTVWTGYDKPLEPHHYLDINEINIAQRYYKYVMETARKQFPNSDW